MWVTADTKRSASLFIPKKNVNNKSIAPETAPKGTEEVADLEENEEEKKYVNSFTMKKKKETVTFQNLRPKLKV